MRLVASDEPTDQPPPPVTSSLPPRTNHRLVESPPGGIVPAVLQPLAPPTARPIPLRPLVVPAVTPALPASATIPCTTVTTGAATASSSSTSRTGLRQNDMTSYSRKASSCTTYREIQTTEARGLFSCLLCLEPSFSSPPRHLDCQHAFCDRCLTDYHRLFCVISTSDVTRQTGTRLITCPTCRQVTRLSPDGATLPPMTSSCATNSSSVAAGSTSEARMRKISLATEASQRCDACLCRKRIEIGDFYCSKCSLNLCNDCKAAHIAQPLFATHTVIHISNKDTVSLGCDLHGGRQVCTYFCFDCDVPACSVCLLHEHGPGQTTPPNGNNRNSASSVGHRTAKLRDALAARRDALKTLLNAFGPKLDRLEVRSKRLNGSGTSVGSGGKTVDGTVGGATTFKSVANGSSHHHVSLPLLHRHHKQNVDTSTTASDTEDDSADNNANNDHVVRFFIINQLSRSASHESDDDGVSDGEEGRLEDCGRETDEEESMESRAELLVNQIGRLRRLFETSTRLLELSQSRRLLAVYSEVAARLQTVLDVELPQLLLAVDTILSREPCSTAASRSSTDPGSCSSITSNGANGGTAGTSTTGGGGNLPRARHSSGMSGATSCTEDSDNNPVECLSLLVRPKLVWKAEKQRSTDPLGELWNPCSVAFLARDEGLVVAEYDMTAAKNNKLCIFDVNGNRVSVLAQGQVQPLGVALTRDGHIAVTDCKGKRVKIMTLSGQTVADIGKGQFGWPYGITVNSRGQLIVTDAFSDSVSVYSPTDGKRIRQFGSSGTRDMNFRNPYHVTVDAKDNIIVADSGNDCVKAFDPTGSHFLFRCDVTTPGGSTAMTSSVTSVQKSLRRRQQRGGRLRGPRGLTVDLRGNILVADDCCRICMFDPCGRYVRNLLTDEDWVKYPEAVHCSRSGSGLLAVTEWNPTNMYAVKVFTLYE